MTERGASLCVAGLAIAEEWRFVEVERPDLAISEELRFDGDPGKTGGGAMRGDSVGKVVGDCAEDPGLDDAIHARPVRIGGDRLVEEDVLLKGELPNGEEELVALAGVVAGGDVEDDGDQTPDVLDSHSLHVEVHEGGGLVKQ